MTELTTEQISKLLVGIARAQSAVIKALVPNNPAATAPIIQSLQLTAGLNRQPQQPMTLEDLPTRILLNLVTSGQAPNLEAWIQTELSKLLG
jgi:hypothetical protein